MRNTWYATAWSSDLGAKPLPKILLEEEIVLYRKADGEVVAMGNRCPHRFVELHGGRVVGDNLQCPYHGLQFGPSGQCAHNPHGAHRPAAARVKSYPAAERHTLIWLWMGDVEKADANLIPDFSILEDTGHTVVGGTLYIEADSLLYSDNLMDLSHTEFVHNLQEPGSLDRSTSNVSKIGDTVLFTREFPEERAHGALHTKFCESMGGKEGDLVSISQSVRWIAPANMLFTATQSRGDKQASLCALHIVAPTRRGECQLIWTGIRNFWIDDPKVSEYLRTTLARVVGEEDIPPIESQQVYIRNRDFMSLRPVLLPSDEALVLVRRSLEQMIHKETAPTNPF